MQPTQFKPGLHDLLLILLVAVSMLAIFISKAPYLHDFAEWVYQAQIIKSSIINPTSVSQFTLASYPVRV